MTISKATLGIITALFSGWFFVDSYFAHAEDLGRHKTKSQIQNWSMEQSLNYMQQAQVKSDLRYESEKRIPDVETVLDLEDTRRNLKTRGVHLQTLQDRATLLELESHSNEPPNKAEQIFNIIAK